MGIIISRFRKKKTSEELLEDIQTKIETLENSSKHSIQREKAIVFKFIFFSVLIYIIAALVFYFYFFPASLWDRMFYMIPLLIFPIIIIIVRRFIKWLYHRDITNSRDKLKDLHTEKKKILDNVMNTETYKKAKEILDKYATDQHRRSPVPMTPLLSSGSPGLNNSQKRDKKPEEGIPLPPILPNLHQRNVLTSTPVTRASPIETGRPVPPSRRLPRPLIPQDRSYLDRLIEAIVGDGPSNRYALICKNCSHHNGMALREEFVYLSFRCAYCGFPNAALKVRPRPNQDSFALTAQRGASQRASLPHFEESRSSSVEREFFQKEFENAKEETDSEVEAEVKKTEVVLENNNPQQPEPESEKATDDEALANEEDTKKSK